MGIMIRSTAVGLIPEASKPLAKQASHLGVESAKGLVQQEEAGVDSQGARESNALPLAPRQLLRVLPPPSRQLHQLQQLLHSAHAQAGRSAGVIARCSSAACCKLAYTGAAIISLSPSKLSRDTRA